MSNINQIATAPPGWYPAPLKPGTQEYWDGQAWSGHIAPLPLPYAGLHGVSQVDNSMAWLIAFTPIFYMLTAVLTLGVGLIVCFAINSLLVVQDAKRMRQAGLTPPSLLWGFTLTPVWLFMRTSRTNDNYIPAIVFCACFVLSLFLI